MGFDTIEINLVYFENDNAGFRGQAFAKQVISAKLEDLSKDYIDNISV